MPPEMSEEEVYEAAKKRVRQKRDFYNHLTVYIIVNFMLVIIWSFGSRGHPWFVWPMVGWGIGIIFHALDVYVFHKHSAWEKKEMEKEIDKIRKSQ